MCSKIIYKYLISKTKLFFIFVAFATGIKKAEVFRSQ